MSIVSPACSRSPSGSRLVSFFAVVDQLVERWRRLRGVEPGLLEQLLVPEQRQRAHGGRHRVVLAVDLHLLHDREELALDLGGTEQLGRQRLQELRLQVVLQPAVEELHHVGPLPGGDRRGDLQPEVVVGDVGVLDLDAGIGRLEPLDQLVDRLDALREGVLPVLDLDRLGAAVPAAASITPRAVTNHLPTAMVCLLVGVALATIRGSCRVPGGRCSQRARTPSTADRARGAGSARPPCRVVLGSPRS